MSALANWRDQINTPNLSPEKEMDVVSIWLIISRAAVSTMTITSGMIGGLLATSIHINVVGLSAQFYLDYALSP